MADILIADDNAMVRLVLSRFLKDQGHAVMEAQNGQEALDALARKGFDLVLTDLCMEPVDGLQVLHDAHRLYPDTPVVIITAHGSISSALEALKGHAFDYVTKPLRMDEIHAAVARALEHRALRRCLAEGRAWKPSRCHVVGFVADAPAMRDICSMITPAAAAGIPLLITGEAGTGKECLARIIHRQGPRAKRPFETLSCFEEPDTFLDLHLFGRRIDHDSCRSCFEKALRHAATGGTLCIREVGLLPSESQTLLLDLLRKERVVLSDETVLDPADVRLVVTDSGCLEKALADGSFDSELYGRIASFTLRMPPLRERREDILPLLSHFLQHSRKEREDLPGLDADAMELLEAYRWPGNVRELKESVSYAVQEAGGESSLGCVHLPPLLLSAIGSKEQQGRARAELEQYRARSLKAFLRSKRDEIKQVIALDKGGREGD